MNRPVGMGIDFGTTNSSAAVAYPDRVEVVPIDASSPMPSSLRSIIYLHRNRQRAAGSDAIGQYLVTGTSRTNCHRCDRVDFDAVTGRGWSDCKQYTPKGGCFDARLLAEIKGEMANPDFSSTHSWAEDFSLPNLVSIVVSELKRRAERVHGGPIDRVVMGHPVAFAGTGGDEFEAHQSLGEDRLAAAAEAAGFSEVELFHEPAAALLGEPLEDGVIVSVDFGGGTFDVAVVEVKDGAGEVLSLKGADVGGALLDGLIFDVKLAELLGLEDTYKGRPIPAWFRTDMRTLGGLPRILGNPQSYAVVAMVAGSHRPTARVVEGILFGGHAHAFYSAVESAKIELSQATETSIEFHRPGLDLSVPFHRGELEAIAQPYLAVVEAQIDGALADAGVKASEVTTVVRTGGSARLVSFVDLLERKFGSERVREREAFTSVASGLGMVAQEVWR